MRPHSILLFIAALIALSSAQAAVQFTEYKNITSLREPNRNIDWEITITAFGNVTNTTIFEYNITPPLDAFSFRINKQYVPLHYTLANGTVSAFIALSDDISANQTNKYLLTYTTNPIQADISRTFPSIFYTDEKPIVVIFSTLRSFTQDNVTDFNVTIILGYGENVKQCDGKLSKGCPDSINADKGVVNGDYIIDYALIPGNQEVTRTVSYEVPTMTILETQKSKINLDGKMVGLIIMKMASGAPFQMPVVGVKTDVECGSVVQVKDQYGTEQTVTCKGKKAVVILRGVAQQQEVQLYLLYNLPASQQGTALSVASIVDTSAKEVTTIKGFSLKVWMVGLIVLIIVATMILYLRQ